MNDILSFCHDIHKSKIDVIIQQLNRRFLEDNLVQLDQLTDTIKLVDDTIGLKEELSTQYKRNKYIKGTIHLGRPQSIGGS